MSRLLYRDALMLVVDKPAGLAVHADRRGGETLTDHLDDLRFGLPRRPEIVHRLDRETSGLMVFAKTTGAATALQAGWEKVEKRYEAVVEGAPQEAEGVFESHLNESNAARVHIVAPGEGTRRAVTRYRQLASGKGRTLVELTLETGRRHQIRVQLAGAGCPVVGDKKYGAKSDPARRLALHACLLRFAHPETGAEMRFESPLPRALARLV